MMPIGNRLLAVALAVAALAGCGTSPPIHYHALGTASSPQVSGGALMLVEILPVAMPERLNREEMVLTGADGRLDLRDGDHWAAPLADEIRQILADALWRQLRAADVYRAPVVPAAGGLPQYRLALRIERFEAVPGQTAVVEGLWTVRRLPQGRTATCRTSIAVPLPGSTPTAAAAALSIGTGQLAQRLADSLGGLDRDDAPTCPTDKS